jgi:CRP-like cAMP-binding protein
MKLSKFTAAGDESVMYFSAPGDVIGALVMTQANSVYPVMVKSMGPSRCIVISRQVYNENWLKNTELVSRIQTQLFSRMQRFQTQQSHTKLPLAAKIAQTLLGLVSYGWVFVFFVICFSGIVIAVLLGVAFESVIRIMSEWTKEGYIEADDKFLRIVRPDVLIDLVGE